MTTMDMLLDTLIEIERKIDLYEHNSAFRHAEKRTAPQCANIQSGMCCHERMCSSDLSMCFECRKKCCQKNSSSNRYWRPLI